MGLLTGVSSVDFTPDAKLLATLSCLIPENYIMGKAPPSKVSEHLDSANPDMPEHVDYSDSTKRNASFVSSDIYQGVAIWNWRDNGQHEIRFNPWDVNELLTSGRRRVLFCLSRPDERRAVSILRLRNSCVTCLKTFHDLWIIAGFSDGAVCFYDPQLRLVRCFEDLDAAAAFSPSGVFLAIGFSNGTVKICEFKLLENGAAAETRSGDLSHWMPELISTRESRDAVTHCTFCRNSVHLAVAHADHLVCLFRFDCRLGNPQLPEEWAFAAQSFASRPAQQPLPTASPHLYSKGYPRLFSVGEDRILVEYDVTNSFEHTGLLKRTSRIVEQRALPAGCLALPSPAGEPDTEVLIYSTEAKATVWSANSMTCVKTASVAMGNGGVLQLALMQDWAHTASHGKKFGNPFKTVSVVAHAGQIVALAASAPLDGYTMVFSCGGSDFTVLQWKVNHQAVQRAFQQGPPGVESVLDRIPGGRLGKFYRTAKEFFYYSQLRSQGERTTRSRQLGGTVPIRELPNLLCAMGQAPTMLELNNILSECRGTHGIMHRHVAAAQAIGGAATPAKPGSIAFERFLELYLNQRVAQPFRYSDVIDAFKQLSKSKDGGEISPDTLTKLLTTTGEAMTEGELSHCLEVRLSAELATSTMTMHFSFSQASLLFLCFAPEAM
ncbi:Whole genome shotgun assembly, allelic scaffold old set, scaffold old scaffoldA_1076, related [Eimeria praecox]|uniref:Cilia- and flagella-associated protein 251 n=1 Tax=Eimeria praecox TaxID=51316 RepID=U6G7Q1_9EIME|nr:Whole genome shotgun assembly, allelic scaffold old set, scaffold old scaffoldA_1076, related [Eimeria praecox]